MMDWFQVSNFPGSKFKRNLINGDLYDFFLISEIELKNVGFVTHAFGGGKKSSAPCGLVALWPCGLCQATPLQYMLPCGLVALWPCDMCHASPASLAALPASPSGWLAVRRARATLLAGWPAGRLATRHFKWRDRVLAQILVMLFCICFYILRSNEDGVRGHVTSAHPILIANCVNPIHHRRLLRISDDGLVSDIRRFTTGRAL